MSLKLYNTLSRAKEDFVPLDPSNVRLYVCGPTVYDYAHIGNARPVIVFDVLFRLLRHVYGPEHVTYVRNITDVDDKINERAARDFPGEDLNVAIRRLTEGTAEIFREDVAALGCLPPTHEPRATDSIAEMVAIIERLIANGHAYVAEGHVLFDVPSMPDYGSLSRRSSAPISACIWAILSVARGCTLGRRQPSAAVSFWYCAAVVSVTRRIASFSGRPGKSRAARALILSSTSVMLRT